MRKKVLGLAAGMIAVVLLITGVMTAVNADNANTGATAPAGVPAGPPPGPHPGRGFGPPTGGAMLEKLAARLNIDKATLQDAFKQIMLEEQQARQTDMFAGLVTDGKLTKEQADAYKAWLNAKPADLPRFPFFAAAKSTVMLDRLLADEKITQAQYDAYKAWVAQKPAVELPKPQRPAGGPPCPQRGNLK
ncbi:MAG: hypothetical protein NT177_00055 [Chloroflexi bacterium]|nr:hypothetical protein [Chloroflexota bacterium]